MNQIFTAGILICVKTAAVLDILMHCFIEIHLSFNAFQEDKITVCTKSLSLIFKTKQI